MADDAPETEIEVLRRGETVLADRLPAGWSVRSVPVAPGDQLDALLEVRAPDGASVILVLEAKRVVEGRDVAALRKQLDAYVSNVPGGQGVVVARYLSPPVQARLQEAGLSYLDATGNMRVEVKSPGLYLSDRGADKDPWRGPGRPRGTLKGAPAANTADLVATFQRLREDPVSGAALEAGVIYLETLFADGPGALGSVMAGRAEEGVGEPETVALSVSILTADLIAALR